MTDFPVRTIRAVVKAYPSVVPYLVGAAARVYCEHKAVERDPDEPGYNEKVDWQEKLQRLILKRLTRQLEQIEQGLQEQYGEKAINTNGLFVDDEGEEYAELIKLFLEGLISGVGLTEAEIGIYLADGSVNARALEAARTYVTDWLEQLDETSRDAVRDAVETFVREPGTTVGDMVDMLSETFGEARSWRIATTETTRVYAQADDLYAQEMAQQYPDMTVTKQWWTNNDDRVCPICGPLHGREVGINEPFDPANGIESPPAHVNCRCWRSTTVRA